MQLELMFMKHYAPNRFLYIKVAKLRTGVGSAEMSHLQNGSLKIYLKRSGWRVRTDVKRGRSKGGGRVGGSWGIRVDVNKELKFWGKFTKKNWWWGGGGSGWGVRVDVNEELKFL